MGYKILRLRILRNRILVKICKIIPLPKNMKSKLERRLLINTLKMSKELIRRGIFSVKEMKILFKQELGIS